MLKTPNAAEFIADALRIDIRLGHVLPGAALRQEELATRFNVSRIPIREAFRVLERDGLVHVYPNRGAFVVQLSPAEMEEITELRVLLEGDLIEKAVAHMEAADFKKLKNAERFARESAGTPDWVGADREFHATLYAAAGRAKQLQLILSLRGELERYQTAYSKLPQQRTRWIREHKEIVHACEEGDASRARKVLVEHIRAAGLLLLRHEMHFCPISP